MRRLLCDRSPGSSFTKDTGCLLTDVKGESPSRRWADERTALKELAEEGWTVAGPYPKTLDLTLPPRQRFYGYALMRAVH